MLIDVDGLARELKLFEQKLETALPAERIIIYEALIESLRGTADFVEGQIKSMRRRLVGKFISELGQS